MKHVVTLRSAVNGAVVRHRLSAAEERHRALDARLQELDRHPYLTPPEQREAAELKKRKLRTKDEIMALRRELF